MSKYSTRKRLHRPVVLEYNLAVKNVKIVSKLATLRQCLFFIQRKDLYSGTSTNSLRRPRTRYSQPHLHSTTFTVKKLPCTKGFILLILINHSAGREGFELFTCSRTPRGPAVADHEENDGDLSIEKSY